MDWGPPRDDDEQAALERVLQLSFGLANLSWASWFERVGQGNIRVLRERGRVVAGLGVYPLRQYWAGKSLPMGGVAGVGVAPERRGAGLARAMMIETLRELRAAGVPLSVLYASTSSLYRGVGYEQARAKITYEAPLASLPRGRHDLLVRAVDPRQHAPFAPLYAARAREWSGHLDRSGAIWSRVAEPTGEVTYGYLVGTDDAPSAYLVHTQKAVRSIHFEVNVRDIVWTSQAAAERIVGLLSDLRSLGDTLVWTGVTSDPLVSMLPEQTYRVRALDRWMLRIVDVVRALEDRGWPPLDGELHLQLTDELLPDNAGPWTLRVSSGIARVERGGRGELALDVAALASMYTGFASPYALRARGALAAPDAVLPLATALFAGPDPWLCDHF